MFPAVVVIEFDEWCVELLDELELELLLEDELCPVWELLWWVLPPEVGLPEVVPSVFRDFGCCFFCAVVLFFLTVFPAMVTVEDPVVCEYWVSLQKLLADPGWALRQ